MDDTLADRARAKERAYIPPPVNGDFYRITDLLDPKERAVVKRVRDFMEAEVAPDHRRLLGKGPVSARNHPEARGARRQYRRGRIPGLRGRRRELAVERFDRHGAGAR